MIFHDVIQQSPEWFKMRLGIATASCFDKIITPKTGKLSASAEKYANDLIGELVTGESSEKFTSYWMERGQQYEADARAMYQVITDYDLASGGFLTDNRMMLGASPDARVFDSNGNLIGGAEIKCPSPGVHIANLERMIDKSEIDPAYIPQVQGQILIGGFEFVDWFSYHPDMPPAYIRIERDDVYCACLSEALNHFVERMIVKIQRLRENGVNIPDRPIVKMHEDRMIEKPNYLEAI